MAKLIEMFVYDHNNKTVRPVWVYDTQTSGKIYRTNASTGEIIHGMRAIKTYASETAHPIKWLNEELLFTTRRQCEAAQRRSQVVLKDFYDKPKTVDQQPDPKYHEPKTPTQIAVRNLIQLTLIRGVDTGLLFGPYQCTPDTAKLLAEAIVDILADHNYKLTKLLPAVPACCDMIDEPVKLYSKCTECDLKFKIGQPKPLCPICEYNVNRRIEDQINSLPKSKAVERTETDAAKARTQPHGPKERCIVCGGPLNPVNCPACGNRCYTCWDADNKPLQQPEQPEQPELFSVFYSLALGDCVFRSSDNKYTPCLNHNHAIQVKKALELRPERIHEHFWYSPSEKPEIAK